MSVCTLRIDERDVAIAAGRIVAMGQAPDGFTPNRVIDAKSCIVAPGLVDLAARLREPGHEHEGMLESEMAAAVAGADEIQSALVDDARAKSTVLISTKKI